MALLLSFMCILILILGIITEKSFLNPLVLFSVLWAFILFLAQFELYGLTGISSYAFLIVFIGIISFFVGYYSFRLIGKNSKGMIVKFELIEVTRELNIIFNILLIISFIVLLITSSTSLTLLLQGYTLHDIRYVVGMDRFSSGVINILYSYVAKPFTILLIPISAYYFFKEQRNTKYLLLAFILITMNVITDGGRFIVLYIIINYTIAFFMLKKPKEYKFKIKRNISFYLLVLFSFSFIIYITVAREVSISETAYVYLVGALPHLSYRLEVFGDLNYSYTYGFSSLLGIIRPFFVVLQSIGFSFPELANYAEGLTMAIEDAVLIGDGVRFNAFTTLFYNFYMDLGILGVVMGSFLYGLFSSFSYYKILNKMNLVNFSIYLLIMQSLLTSMVRFQFSKFSFALCFIYLMIITIRVKRNRR
ncbi:O-antigen polymerase [Solibacillus sp. FSL W7-1464]|uniref:O-antigen polymerase n=1 Tax=Solibacillus sp. FSL W7-1464 TaxID=2921706 RepID=UPI0030FD1A29